MRIRNFKSVCLFLGLSLVLIIGARSALGQGIVVNFDETLVSRTIGSSVPAGIVTSCTAFFAGTAAGRGVLSRAASPTPVVATATSGTFLAVETSTQRTGAGYAASAGVPIPPQWVPR